MVQPVDFKSIRSWRSSQNQAFEELCFQLRDPTPPNASLVKTGSPDGGLEWYFRFNNGVEWGWQAKYSFDIESLLGLMQKSLRTVVKKRPNCRRLTFCIPFDLPDERQGRERKSAREKFESRKKSWKKNIKGADRVKIELWSEGELLERLTSHPAQRGIARFFWDKEVFSPEWCRKRLDVTVKLAGERYSPELHIDLPVAFALEGLGRSNTFWERFNSRCAEVRKFARSIRLKGATGVGVTGEVREVIRAGSAWQEFFDRPFGPARRLDASGLLDLTRKLTEAVRNAFPEMESRRPAAESKRQQNLRERRSHLTHKLNRLHSALIELEDFLEGPAGTAAQVGTLLLTGEAGQGKTHLFCDEGERAVEGGQPAIVLLGAQFPGPDVWTAIAKQLGLGGAGTEVVVGAMQAAGEASGAPFLLLVDALNEASEPEAWRTELPALLAEIDGNPWISVAVSLRSSFIPIVLPPSAELPEMAELEHPGFEGRELEATERFFDYFGLQQPRIPLLTPEFTNPLFLKLYCEGMKGLGLEAPEKGSIQVGDVFGRYLEWKEQRVDQKLKLDPELHVVSAALKKFSEELLEAGRDSLPYEEGATLVNSFAPQKTEWPNTLAGQLQSEGLLTSDLAWDWETDDYVRTLRFSYQRFGDYQAVRALLTPFNSAQEFQAELKASAKLRGKIRNAPAGWIEALSVELPEKLGLELLDAMRWRLDNPGRWTWDRALVRSIVSRHPETVSDRSRQLLVRAQKRTPRVREDVLEGLLAVAPDPTHPLNAAYLHARLLNLSMPDRDVAWSMETYWAFGNGGPLDRLIRWAARNAHREAPDEVVELAALPMIWCFTSPNRRLRDFATKALVNLLLSRIAILPQILRRFEAVNDPYVLERLSLVAYGAILCGGDQEAESTVQALSVLRAIALDSPDQVPNIITRDATRGIAEWCLRKGLISQDEYDECAPPYRSDPPAKTRTEKQLERAYGRYRKDRKGEFIGSEYGALFLSLFDMGDFARYVVEGKVRDFTQYPLDKPAPSARPKKRWHTDKKKLAELEASLTDSQKALVGGEKDAAELVDALSPEQRQLLMEAMHARPRVDRRAEYPISKARAWLFERVLSLGWTPERFEDWEDTYARSSSRSPSSQERFGKKYQWIALRELVARLADNFYRRAWPGDDLRPYEGPWQFFGRDLDPTLPPAARRDGERDGLTFEATFPVDDLKAWWVPPGPSFTADDSLPSDTWAQDPTGIPEFEPLVRTQDEGGANWVVLQAYYNWDDERRDDDRGGAGRQRNVWSHIKSWLVQKQNAGRLVDFLESRTLMGNWMPDGLELTDAAYLGEMPWGEAVREYSADWREVSPRRESGPEGLLVYPSWIQYHWEGNVGDASIDDGVFAMLPAPLLFDGGSLTWDAGNRAWRSLEGEIVAQYREADELGQRHSVLLVREKWLHSQLDQGGWELVVGWLGEKQLFDRDLVAGGLVGSWTEINGVASLGDEAWQFGDRRLDVVDRRGDG
jgi:hypothetical protein